MRRVTSVPGATSTSAMVAARLTAARETPSWRPRTRSILTAHVAQVIPSTSNRRVSERTSVGDCVALLLDGALDGAQVDDLVVIGDGDGGIGHRDLHGGDALEGAYRALERHLAVVAVDLGNAEGGFGGHFHPYCVSWQQRCDRLAAVRVDAFGRVQRAGPVDHLLETGAGAGQLGGLPVDRPQVRFEQADHVTACRLPFGFHLEDRPDVGEAEPRRLGVPDEPDPLGRGGVVQRVPVPGASRLRHQPELLVEPDGGGADPRLASQFADSHDPELSPTFKSTLRFGGQSESPGRGPGLSGVLSGTGRGRGPVPGQKVRYCLAYDSSRIFPRTRGNLTGAWA